MAGGAVSIGASLPTASLGTGAGATTGVSSSGFTATALGQFPGNGGSITISGSSITLPFGAAARGGNNNAPQSATALWNVDGGDAGTISLTATGAVNVGTFTNLVGLYPLATTGGGVNNAATGLTAGGGAGGNIYVSGATIALEIAQSTAGSTTAVSTNGYAGDYGGNITLVATAASGAAVTLYGNGTAAVTNTSPNPTTQTAVLASSGGRINTTAANDGMTDGPSGNITIAGDSNGGPLKGSAFIKFATTTGTAGIAGSNVIVAASAGAPSIGGTVLLNGPVQAATANIESMHLYATNSTVTFDGPVGTITPLSSLVIGCCNGATNTSLEAGSNEGAVTFAAPVTVLTQLLDYRSTTGSLAFNGLLSTPNLTMTPGGVTLALNGGAVFSGTVTTSGQPLSLAGTLTFTSTYSEPLTFGPAPVVLVGTTTFEFDGAQSAGHVQRHIRRRLFSDVQRRHGLGHVQPSAWRLDAARRRHRQRLGHYARQQHHDFGRRDQSQRADHADGERRARTRRRPATRQAAPM